MDPKLRVKEYVEYPMGVHNFIRGVQMPLTFAAQIALVYYHRKAYTQDVLLVPECALCIFGTLLILIAEFGFFYYASYSYYAVQGFEFNCFALSAYSFAYLYHNGYSPELKIKMPDRVITLPDIALLAIGAGVLFCLFWVASIYVYYRRRKFMFVESKEDKRMVKGNLKAQEIDFNPKFDRDKMSRSELKAHMNKRFDEVEGAQSEEEKPEANPFDT